MTHSPTTICCAPRQNTMVIPQMTRGRPQNPAMIQTIHPHMKTGIGCFDVVDRFDKRLRPYNSRGWHRYMLVVPRHTLITDFEQTELDNLIITFHCDHGPHLIATITATGVPLVPYQCVFEQPTPLPGSMLLPSVCSFTTWPVVSVVPGLGQEAAMIEFLGMDKWNQVNSSITLTPHAPITAIEIVWGAPNRILRPAWRAHMAQAMESKEEAHQDGALGVRLGELDPSLYPQVAEELRPDV